jgi:hypothetical protein
LKCSEEIAAAVTDPPPLDGITLAIYNEDATPPDPDDPNPPESSPQRISFYTDGGITRHDPRAWAKGVEPAAEHIDRRDIDHIRRRALNIEKIRRTLRWSPQVALETGLRHTAKTPFRVTNDVTPFPAAGGDTGCQLSGIADTETDRVRVTTAAALIPLAVTIAPASRCAAGARDGKAHPISHHVLAAGALPG